MDPKRIKKGLIMLDPTYQRVPCNVYLFCMLSKVKRKTCGTFDQLSDKGFKVVLEPNHCLIYDACGSIVLIGKRVNNIYLLDLHYASFSIYIVCLQKRYFSKLCYTKSCI